MPREGEPPEQPGTAAPAPRVRNLILLSCASLFGNDKVNLALLGFSCALLLPATRTYRRLAKKILASW